MNNIPEHINPDNPKAPWNGDARIEQEKEPDKYCSVCGRAWYSSRNSNECPDCGKVQEE